MDPSSTYVFRGNACGVSARIRRPDDLTMPVQAQSSLPPSGGVSESKVGPYAFGGRKPTGPAVRAVSSDSTNFVTFDSASTSAHGDFVDPKQAVAATRGQAAYGDLPAVTTVTSEVVNLNVVGRLTVGRVVMQLKSQSVAQGEALVTCDGSVLENVAIDGYPLAITLGCDFFCENDTMAKLGTAAASGKNKQCFFDAGPAAPYGFLNPTLHVKCTLVTEMKWAADPHPTAVIQGNTVHIPNFGSVHFAEMFVSASARRLTMVRWHLGKSSTEALRRDAVDGSDGGDGSAGSGDTNGSAWPPTAP